MRIDKTELSEIEGQEVLVVSFTDFDWAHFVQSVTPSDSVVVVSKIKYDTLRFLARKAGTLPVQSSITIADGFVQGDPAQIEAVQQAIFDSEELRRLKAAEAEQEAERARALDEAIEKEVRAAFDDFMVEYEKVAPREWAEGWVESWVESRFTKKPTLADKLDTLVGDIAEIESPNEKVVYIRDFIEGLDNA